MFLLFNVLGNLRSPPAASFFLPVSASFLLLVLLVRPSSCRQPPWSRIQRCRLCSCFFFVQYLPNHDAVHLIQIVFDGVHQDCQFWFFDCRFLPIWVRRSGRATTLTDPASQHFKVTMLFSKEDSTSSLSSSVLLTFVSAATLPGIRFSIILW